MPGTTFMQCVQALAAQIDGARDVSESQINRLEQYLMDFPIPERNELRRQMILIVAGLSRLEVRMTAADGPLNVAV